VKVLEEIARGGFGRVEKIQLPDYSIVARKVFDPTPDILAGASVDELRARFAREVKVQRSLPDAWCMPVLDADLDAAQPWFTMPLAARNFEDQLRHAISMNEIPSEELMQILGALESLHSLGYVHRDLKPSNVLLHDGRWKLSDLGLVRPLQSGTTTLTVSGTAWGTHHYCAPEQAQAFKRVRATADIYAFGCILHDRFGPQPFPSRTPFIQHDCAGPMGPIVHGCTFINPARRFADIASLRATLADALAKPGIIESRDGSALAAKLAIPANLSVEDVGEIAR
jgi:eukaryotic-like serine/threonine-protein kinase